MKSFKLEAVVLYRQNFKDADRIVTIYSKEMGKVSLLAKGVRKVTSRKKGSLEPATHGYFYCTNTKFLPLLTQSEIIKSYSNNIDSLERITQLHQILEISSLLTVENQENTEVFDLIISMLESLRHPYAIKSQLLSQIRLLIEMLGFTHDKQFSETSLKEYIEDIAQQGLRSKRFLAVPKIAHFS